jgi:hypothetical protein
MSAHAEVEEQIERLRKGNTLPENEVKVLCEKVRRSNETRTSKGSLSLPFIVLESIIHPS